MSFGSILCYAARFGDYLLQNVLLLMLLFDLPNSTLSCAAPLPAFALLLLRASYNLPSFLVSLTSASVLKGAVDGAGFRSLLGVASVGVASWSEFVDSL